jgi:hypothetical protein
MQGLASSRQHSVRSKTGAGGIRTQEDFFDMKTVKERDSVRASLFKTAKMVLDFS